MYTKLSIIIILLFLGGSLLAQSASPPPPDYYISITGSEPFPASVTVNDIGPNPYPIFYSFTGSTEITITAHNYAYPDGAINIFVRWEGDILSHDNPLTIQVNGPVHLKAVYFHGTPLSTPVLTPEPNPFTYIYGDVDKNNSVTIVDALIVAQYHVGLNSSGFTAPLEYGDVNLDERVNIIDALIIARYYVGLETSLPI